MKKDKVYPAIMDAVCEVCGWGNLAEHSCPHWRERIVECETSRRIKAVIQEADHEAD